MTAKRKLKQSPPVEGCEECEGSVKSIWNLTLAISCREHGMKQIPVSGLLHAHALLNQKIDDATTYQVGREAVARWVLERLAGPGKMDIAAIAKELVKVIKESQTLIDKQVTKQEVSKNDSQPA